MKATISIEFDTDSLAHYSDSYLAQLWHVTQANPAPIEDVGAADLVERVGREIISRFLAATPADLWNHQGRHPYWNKILQLQQEHPTLQIEMPGAIVHDDRPEPATHSASEAEHQYVGEAAQLRSALERIERWELPETGETWPSGRALSYEAAYGSNGIRDYIRGVARQALSGHPAAPTQEGGNHG